MWCRQCSSAQHLARQPPEYAEQSLKMFCTVFRVPYNAQSKTAYRYFKDPKGLDVTGPMQRFINSVESLPVSTAECERGFSCMNIICTELRSSLSISHMSSLMFIGLVGPPVALFKPLSYVKSWLAYNAGETLNLRQAHAEKWRKRKVKNCHCGINCNTTLWGEGAYNLVTVKDDITYRHHISFVYSALVLVRSVYSLQYFTGLLDITMMPWISLNDSHVLFNLFVSREKQRQSQCHYKP